MIHETVLLKQTYPDDKNTQLSCTLSTLSVLNERLMEYEIYKKTSGGVSNFQDYMMDICFESGKNIAEKGGEWALPFICGARDTVGTSPLFGL